MEGYIMTELIAQAIGIVAMGANIISFQFKSRHHIILCQLLVSALFTVNMFMLNAVMGGLLNIIGIFRALVFYKPELIKIPRKVINGIFILLYAASYVLVFAVFDKDPTLINFIIELLPLIGATALTVGFSLKDSRAIRMCGFINSPCWLIYNIVNWTIGGILCEVFGLTSIISAYIRLDRKKKTH